MSRIGLMALLVALLAAPSVAQGPAPATAPAGVGRLLLDTQKSVGPSGKVQALLAVTVLYVLLLTTLPLRQPFYLMSVYPLLVLMLETHKSRRVRLLKTAMLVTLVLLLILPILLIL